MESTSSQTGAVDLVSSVVDSFGSCPCGSGQAAEACCLPLIQGQKKAQTPADLLRARYTAFCRGDIDFIIRTVHPKSRDQVNRQEMEDWSKNSQWLGLKILKTEQGNTSDSSGVVYFHARYETDGKTVDHGEKSYFEKDAQGTWFFVDAEPLVTGPVTRNEPKVGRNDPCPCGSQKKFKKCCG